MKIAVLMPYYNSESTILRSVKSIVEQTYKDEIKLFAVNNNSTDGSFRVLKDYCDSNLDTEHLFCDIPGIVPALNTGLFSILSSKDNFDFVARIDADDIWLPEKLEKQIEFLKINPEISILGTQIYTFKDSESDIIENLNYEYPCEDIDIRNTLFKNCNCIAHPSVIVRSIVYKKIGVYDDIYKFAEDYQFWLKAAIYFKFANLKEKLVKYRISNNPNYNPIIPLICKNLYGKAICHNYE